MKKTHLASMVILAGLSVASPVIHADSMHAPDRRSESVEVMAADNRARQAVGGGQIAALSTAYVADHPVWMVTVHNGQGTYQVTVSQGDYHVMSVQKLSAQKGRE